MFSHKLKLYRAAMLGGLLLSSPLYLLAGTPVKSIDKSGNVTYSDKPVAGAKVVSEVPIEEGPSQGEINAAKKQAQQTVKAAKAVEAPKPAKPTKPAATSGTTITEEKVINAGAQRKPLPVKPPKPKPPIDRPGINPPPAVRPRPGTGAK